MKGTLVSFCWVLGFWGAAFRPLGLRPNPVTDRNLFAKVVSALAAKQPGRPRKNYLALATKSLNGLIDRKLGIDKLMDMVMIPRYDEHPLVMPMSIPQISDARITVQTFNPPPKPLTPGMLPKQDFKFDINLPAAPQAVPPHPDKTINVVLPGLIGPETKEMVSEAFKAALRRHLTSHPGLQLSEDGFRFNLLSTPTERALAKGQAQKRMQGLAGRVAALQQDYADYQRELGRRLESLGHLLSQTEKIKLSFLIG